MSITQMLQQGGIFAAAELSRKYPQIAFWINIAAAALDFILKFTKKTPLRIVPTVFTTNQNQWQNYNYQTQNYQTSFVSNQTNGLNAFTQGSSPESAKISIYSELPPNDNGFVTAYPLVIHNWQANPDPEIISLPTPALMEPCLHVGQNVLRSTDLINDWLSDSFTRDFKLVVKAANGFRKEFPLQKNVGLGGWELNLTEADLQSYPNINMNLESQITGKRGFNTVTSPSFELPLPITGSWTIDPESQKAFTVGGKRAITLRNQVGNCRCLQAVIYKPSFGGEFVFESNGQENALRFGSGNREVSFNIDTTDFKPGQGKVELRQYGGEIITLPIELFPGTAATESITARNVNENIKVDVESETPMEYQRVKATKPGGKSRKRTKNN